MNIAPRPDQRPDSMPAHGWTQTLPACYRSEAFAEDLPEVPAPILWPLGPAPKGNEALHHAPGR